ncbi:MAG: acetate kinase [Calditrichaeota bacterium]|nr:acetate kinase [Calditrichota bacterium]RQV92168.1 MAG: acetate kinase [bacterium]
MKVLVLNAGSSSVKYQLIIPEERKVLAKGLVERIGLSGAMLSHETFDKSPVKMTGEILDHRVAIEYVLSILLSPRHGVLKDKNEIDAVGHRVVHGGEAFSGSVLINSDMINEMTKCIDFAPLHNPPNLKGIAAAKSLLPDVPQVGVFDTAFHQTMPSHAYIYGLPYTLYKRHGIRRYGFHGTSHRYVAHRAAELVNKPLKELKIITCHLGNGSSIAAVKDGQSIDTSMGFTPLEGLLMGTRTGDMDPAIILHIMGKEDLSPGEMNTMLNKHSGILGVSGISSDMREIEEKYHLNDRAKLAMDIFIYRIKKYIGAYTAAMGGTDIIVFTAGIGENSDMVREMTCSDMEFLGIKLDKNKNKTSRKKEAIITTEDSRVKVMVIPTNEELVIALDTAEIVRELHKQPV